MAPGQPSQPAAMPPVFMGQRPTTIPPVNPKWHVAKIVIRSFSLLFAIIAVILAAVLAAQAFQIENDYNSFWVYVFVLPSCIAVIAWDLAEFITLCVRRRSTGRGIHPGAHVGVDLILWLLLSIFWGILCAVIGYGFDYSYDSETDSYVAVDDNLTARNISVAIVTFMIILTVIHFFLFVRACIETNQRNRVKNQPIYVIQGPVPGTSQHPYSQIPGNANGIQFYYAPPMQQKTPSSHRAPPMMTPAVPHPAPTHTSGHVSPLTPQTPPLEGYYAPKTARTVGVKNVEKPTPLMPPAQEIPVASGSNSSEGEQPAVAGPSNST